MEVIVFLTVLALIFFLLYLLEKKNCKRREKQIENTIRKHYGERRDKNFSPYEMEEISYLGKKRREKSYLDDLTWNDLSMDQIYGKSCYCKSQIGEEYYYYMLRNPLKEWEKLEKLEEKISCFSEKEKVIGLQKKLELLGKIKKYSIFRYLDFLTECQKESNKIHYLGMLFFLLFFLIMKFHLLFSLVFLFILIFFQIITYFKVKARLDPYLQSLRYLFQVTKCMKEILPLLPREWEEERTEIIKILPLLEKSKKNSFFLLSYGRMSGQGLELILDYVRMIFHIDIIKFNQMIHLLVQRKEELFTLYYILGKLDACIGIAEFRNTLNVWTRPEKNEEGSFKIEGGYHFLLDDPVSNSLVAKQPILLTGSNASGKSTFLKMIGVNIVMAQSINTCTAVIFQYPMGSLYTCLSVKDSLKNKESYYMAEIKAIKRILDSKEENEAIICIMDEVLRGTNTVERIAASTEILHHMAHKGFFVFAATHDFELTKTLEKEYEQYHFEERIKENDILFSYLLLPGKAESTNAIDLLSFIGYDKEIVKNARDRMIEFQGKGEWG